MTHFKMNGYGVIRCIDTIEKISMKMSNYMTNKFFPKALCTSDKDLWWSKNRGERNSSFILRLQIVFYNTFKLTKKKCNKKLN